MPASPIDRRVAKTKIALRDAMLSLLPLRGWDDMGIQEICDRANVGRSTFYMHYSSKDDLLSEGLNNLRDSLLAHPPSVGLQDKAFSFMPGLLAHMAEQRDVFRAVIGRRSGQRIEQLFTQMVAQLVEHDLQRKHLPNIAIVVQARYFAGGIVGVMSWWVDEPRANSLGEIELHLQQLSQAAMAGNAPEESGRAPALNTQISSPDS